MTTTVPHPGSDAYSGGDNPDTTCDNCQAGINDHQHSLLITLDSWGERGFIDTFLDPAVTIELCEHCARSILETRWGAKALTHLNLNVGHVCNGQLTWTPQPACTSDPDQHGWRTVHVVTPDEPGRCPDERAPLSGPGGKAARYAICDTADEAERIASGLRTKGIPVKVRSSLVGNETNHSETVTLEQWRDWWPGHDAAWRRHWAQDQRRQRVRIIVRHPLRVGRHYLSIVRRLRASRGTNR